MTVDSSMSSGYCSLDEELEDCFFTAKTTFFRNVQSKQPSKVNTMITSTFKGGNKLGGLRGKLASLASSLPPARAMCWKSRFRHYSGQPRSH